MHTLATPLQVVLRVNCAAASVHQEGRESPVALLAEAPRPDGSLASSRGCWGNGQSGENETWREKHWATLSPPHTHPMVGGLEFAREE